jgi:hypothetical protein
VSAALLPALVPVAEHNPGASQSAAKDRFELGGGRIYLAVGAWDRLEFQQKLSVALAKQNALTEYQLREDKPSAAELRRIEEACAEERARDIEKKKVGLCRPEGEDPCSGRVSYLRCELIVHD